VSAGEPTRRRILFVDDEQNVLDGLRNLLRKQRNQWDMLFAISGKAALEELARSPVDVIVSDMRMPGMDGAELLTRVRELYPQTARIVLSGHAERDAIARVVSVAHQFLSKPADATAVRTVVERTCQFQGLMQDEGIRRVVGGLQQLPSLPDTYWQLVRATEDPEVAIAELARINDDLLFVPSINHHAYVIRTSNGSIAADFPASDWIWTTPAVDQGKIYFGDFSGKVYALDITSGAKELWTPASVNGERVKAGTAIINGVLVVADRKPVVTFINAQDGSIVNRVPLPPGSGTVRAAVTAHENAAYIVTDKGQLFRAESPKVTPIQLSGVKK